MKNHYKTLNVREDASQLEVKVAYRTMAMRHHPDRNQGSKESHERFVKIEHAYSTLGDPKKREAYDDELRDHRARIADEERRHNVPTHVAPAPQPVASSQDNDTNLWGLGVLALGGLGLAFALSNKRDANGRFHGSDGRFRSGRFG